MDPSCLATLLLAKNRRGGGGVGTGRQRRGGRQSGPGAVRSGVRRGRLCASGFVLFNHNFHTVKIGIMYIVLQSGFPLNLLKYLFHYSFI